MTTTTTATTAPPTAGTSNGTGLPPALPGGSDPAASTGTPATSTQAPNTALPTAGNATQFDPGQVNQCAAYKTVPAPSSNSTTPPPSVAGATGGPATKGGGGFADLGPILNQLTEIIGKLSTAVGGVAGGGPTQKGDPGQTPGQVAGANGGGPTQKGDPGQTPGQVADANGGGPTQAMEGCKHHAAGGGEVAGANGAADAAQAAGGGPVQKGDPGQAPGQVAGANGGGPVQKGDPGQAPGQVAGAAGGGDAAAGAANVAGGGGTDAQMAALVTALQGVIEVLTQLVTLLQGKVGGITGGGPTQKGDPTQGEVKGENGGPEQKPTQKPEQKDKDSKVGGKHGKGDDKKPEQKPDQKPTQKPDQEPPAPPVPGTPPPPPTQVGGDNGPGQGDPTQVGGKNGPGQTPVQGPPPKPEVGGANGGPEQVPTQKPTQTPTQVAGAHEGNVILDNDDGRWSAKLTAKSGKSENSVELWGDPHVVVNMNGKEEKFDIGFGEASVTLFDGTVVSWNTYDKGEKLAGQRPKQGDDVSYILKDFKIDSAGSEFDRSVTTSDRDGDKGDQMGLTTALTDAHLKELVIALRTMENPMSKKNPNPNWVSPAYQDPAQNPGQNTTQQGG